MRRPRPVQVLVAVIVALIAVWIAVSTEWGDVEIPTPLRGEAARNPFYAAQRLVTTLGATSERRQSLGDTSEEAVVVLSSWAWDISAARRAELERWVEAGGRLVVDAALISGSDAFERWSGIERQRDDELDDAPDEDVFRAPEIVEPCQQLLEISYEGAAADAKPVYYDVCDFDYASWLVTSRRVLWVLNGDEYLQAARVAVGDGTVTVINGVPFIRRALFEGDHGQLLVAATALRPGDHVVFMSEEDVASLPELVWRYGAPVVAVLLLFIALALWRGAVRFGPLAAPVEGVRRSLGEQILGTGRFAVRVGGGVALHAAAARALHEAAARRVAGYERLSSAERVAAIARIAAVDAGDLAAAVNRSGGMRTLELKHGVALLEATRRQLISGSQWSKHGKPN